MSIYTNQYQKLLSQELLRYLMIGTLPDINEISSRLSKALDKKGKVIYKYMPQPFKEVFQNEVYNKGLNSIKFDIDVFNETLIELFSDASKRLNFADLYNKVTSYELEKLGAALENLLFVSNNSDFYFEGAFETFSDVSKTNVGASSKDVVDLAEGCIALPYGGRNTHRIDPGLLINEQTASIKVSNPEVVISSNQIPNSKFGNIFTDTLSIWGYEIITNQNIPFSIEFKFPLNINRSVESEYFVSRFEVVPHSIKDQKFEITISNDDVNYLSLLGYEKGIDLKEQKKIYGLDFETSLVQYVKIKLSKLTADEEILSGTSKQYRYIFGLKKFAAFQTGRVQSATYISKPFTFTKSIGKVSIDAESTIPSGCSVEYSIAPVINDSIGAFIPIVPVGNASTIGASKVVKFNSVLDKAARFVVTTSGDDAPIVYGNPFQGKEFYRVGKALGNKPIFGNSLLYRGYKSWYRDITGGFEILNVDDNYVSFAENDIEAMYATTTEVPGISVPSQSNDGIYRTQLVLSKPPYYDSSKGHSLKPQPGVNNSQLNIMPNYAIYKISLNKTTSRITAPFVLSSSRTQYLPVSSFILYTTDGTKRPVIQSQTGVLYTEGTDFTYETIDIGGQSRPTSRIIIPNGSRFLDTAGNVQPLALEFVYSNDPDITHKVIQIQGNTVMLEHASYNQLDSLEIIYRFIPVSPSTIIKSSIRVSNLPSSSTSRIFYVEGRDYVVDPSTGGIQRIPTGSIDTKGSVYVQFSYRGSSTNLQTFLTWAFINSTEGNQIKFDLDPSTKKNKLVTDATVGESFYVNTKDGLIELTKATATNTLPYGWVQFIVRSKDPDTFSSYGTNLIDQVIQLKDINKKKIFRENNYYFNEIVAFREPLQEKTLNHLKVNTLLSDHSVFAIDSLTDPYNSYIVLNFKPNETTELYCKTPTDDSDESNPPASSDEEFLFKWKESLGSTEAYDSLVVKIDLRRNPDVYTSLTPKVMSYQLRVGS